MAYSRDNIARVREEFVARHHAAAAEAEERKRLLHARLPELAAMDREISAVGIRVFSRALAGGDVEAAVAQMKAEHDALRARRAALLVRNGYPTDYTDIHYQCEKCQDMGFIGTQMCSCMREALIMAGYESSGIASLMRTQSFDTFTLDYYTGKERAGMEMNFRALRDFAGNFAERRGENWLLAGPTGLGKTHLSTSVARAVIDAGFNVVYDTAQGIFSAYEAARFGRGAEDADPDGRYLSCDLLIVDDLGTELTNNFTISCLYNLINTRLNRRCSTIFNTNLAFPDLRQRYADRITSRLFGEFRILVFSGRDIRAQKLKN